jgi:hypothetical protein
MSAVCARTGMCSAVYKTKLEICSDRWCTHLLRVASVLALVSSNKKGIPRPLARACVLSHHCLQFFPQTWCQKETQKSVLQIDGPFVVKLYIHPTRSVHCAL